MKDYISWLLLSVIRRNLVASLMLQVWVFSFAWRCKNLPSYPCFQDDPFRKREIQTGSDLLVHLRIFFLVLGNGWSHPNQVHHTLLSQLGHCWSHEKQDTIFCTISIVTLSKQGRVSWKKGLKFLVSCAFIGTQTSLVQIQSFRRNTLLCQ